MSTNKAQGQTLQFVGIYLPDHVFTHGQLYVAFSRVTDPSALAVCLNNPDGFTRNIVFQEVLWLYMYTFSRTMKSLCPLSHSVRSTGWPLVLLKCSSCQIPDILVLDNRKILWSNHEVVQMELIHFHSKNCILAKTTKSACTCQTLSTEWQKIHSSNDHHTMRQILASRNGEQHW